MRGWASAWSAAIRGPEADGPDKPGNRNPYIQISGLCGETSKRREEFNDSPLISGEGCDVVDAPEICQSPGRRVIGEFLAAIETGDEGTSACDGFKSVKVVRNRFARCYWRTLMAVRTDVDEAKKSAQKEGEPEDECPPRLRTR